MPSVHRSPIWIWNSNIARGVGTWEEVTGRFAVDHGRHKETPGQQHNFGPDCMAGLAGWLMPRRSLRARRPPGWQPGAFRTAALGSAIPTGPAAEISQFFLLLSHLLRGGTSGMRRATLTVSIAMLLAGRALAAPAELRDSKRVLLAFEEPLVRSAPTTSAENEALFRAIRNWQGQAAPD